MILFHPKSFIQKGVIIIILFVILSTPAYARDCCTDYNGLRGVWNPELQKCEARADSTTTYRYDHSCPSSYKCNDSGQCIKLAQGACPDGYVEYKCTLGSPFGRKYPACVHYIPAVVTNLPMDIPFCSLGGGPLYFHLGEVPGYENPAKIINRQCCDMSNGSIVNCDKPGLDFKTVGVSTTIGCIPTHPEPLVAWFFKISVRLAGGIAFVLMAFASFQLMTSSGNPEKLKKGQEMLVSAGAGLLFIIFSVFLLRLIGITILEIPGFK